MNTTAANGRARASGRSATIIVCASQEHGNTRRVAEAIAVELDALLLTPAEVEPADLAGAELVGFGSGVRYGNVYASLRALVDRMPQGSHRPCFVFSTSGFGWKLWHGALRRQLAERGFEVVGELACKGLDTMGPLALVGGLNKGRPNDQDLEAARRFARAVRARVRSA